MLTLLAKLFASLLVALLLFVLGAAMFDRVGQDRVEVLAVDVDPADT